MIRSISFFMIDIPADRVQEVYMGHVVQAGVGQAPARQATIYAGQFVSFRFV